MKILADESNIIVCKNLKKVSNENPIILFKAERCKAGYQKKSRQSKYDLELGHLLLSEYSQKKLNVLLELIGCRGL